MHVLEGSNPHGRLSGSKIQPLRHSCSSSEVKQTGQLSPAIGQPLSGKVFLMLR